MKIGYVRVSSMGQSLDLQMKALKNAGREKIFSEKVSGAKCAKKEFNSMMEFTRHGDQIVATKPDKLSRSSLGLQNTAKTFENKKLTTPGVLEQNIDTSNPFGKLLFDMIGIVAEFEREMISERATAERKTAWKRVSSLAEGKLSKMTRILR